MGPQTSSLPLSSSASRLVFPDFVSFSLSGALLLDILSDYLFRRTARNDSMLFNLVVATSFKKIWRGQTSRTFLWPKFNRMLSDRHCPRDILSHCSFSFFLPYLRKP
jgi:hypothetical protein